MQLSLHSVHLVLFSVPLLTLFCSTLISPTGGNQGCNSTATVGDGSEALSPDDTLFAHLRCFELFASKQSDQRDHDAADWLGSNERYLRRTERTPSFLHCVLCRMRLFDELHDRFNVTVIRTQYNAYKPWMTLSEEAVKSFINDIEATGKLNSSTTGNLYDAFEQLFYDHYNAFFQLFLRDTAVLQRMHHDKSCSVRKPNQTVVQFCEQRMSAELWDDICHIRAYEISNRTEAMERHIACIFRGFQYLDWNSSIHTKEIQRDYELIGSLDEGTKKYIHQCAVDAAQELEIPKRSLAMYSCLLDGAYSEKFKEAFDYHEIRSGNLTFILKNLPYERDQVKQQILALDKEHCNEHM
ncbi:37 kDa salivary gland allergen Aed a 2-like [Anopheles maculipalpis]|uniref:37 kDa salivary gland allergen Aed a 2-like n=1 Tax=Anopheles maculipalpis TaxID=1496333 RepID=UPI0021594CBD|nr:37 kDa salivary gland allergen Aed a 2-like [Anopheles maculipalpis]